MLRDVALELRDRGDARGAGPERRREDDAAAGARDAASADGRRRLGARAARCRGSLASSRPDRLPRPRAAALPRPDRRENLRFQARLHGLAEPAPSGSPSCSSACGMSPSGRQRVRNLSAGMVQRLAVCRAVLHEPELLLLDEPSSHLDPEAAGVVERFCSGAPGGPGCWSPTTSTPGSPRRTACWRCAPAARSPTGPCERPPRAMPSAPGGP